MGEANITDAHFCKKPKGYNSIVISKYVNYSNICNLDVVCKNVQKSFLNPIIHSQYINENGNQNYGVHI